MKKQNSFLLIAIILLSVLSISFTPVIPVTGGFDNSLHFAQIVNTTTLPSVNYAGTNQVKKAAASNFSFSVVQQPSGNASYVSTKSNTATQFSLATQYGSIGLIAHNYLAGKSFFNLSQGQTITLTFSDGTTAKYTVSGIYKYQALSPTSPYSQFVDLNNPDQVLSVDSVFNQIYAVSGRLVLQTCISKNGVSSWGRLFVVANPA